MRVVDQLIEYARERSLLTADQVARLEAAGFIRHGSSTANAPADGRWTERHWRGYTWERGSREDEVWEDDGTNELDETDVTVRASKSGRRSQGTQRGQNWTGRRSRRVRRTLARAWRQPGAKGDRAKAA